jgi:hypothetical protein
MWKKSKINPNNTKKFYSLATNSSVTGCTMIFNNQAKNKSLPYSGEFILHDWWIALFTSYSGIIDYLNLSTILYRQHTANAVGVLPHGWRYYTYRSFKFMNVILDNYKLLKDLNKIKKINIYKYLYYKVNSLLKRIIFL